MIFTEYADHKLMMRASCCLCLLSFAALSAQADLANKADEDGFVALSQWEGDRSVWKINGELIQGRSNGVNPAPLLIPGREFSTFELRFEARVMEGAVRVKVLGPGRGPVGVALEIDTRTVYWSIQSSHGYFLFSNTPGEWAEYRVMVRGGGFRVDRNGKRPAHHVGLGDGPQTGQLALQLVDDEPSIVELRKMRIRESLPAR